MVWRGHSSSQTAWVGSGPAVGRCTSCRLALGSGPGLRSGDSVSCRAACRRERGEGSATTATVAAVFAYADCSDFSLNSDTHGKWETNFATTRRRVVTVTDFINSGNFSRPFQRLIS